jgi:uncharacterized protein YndB with AHSA1/START domain
MIDSPSAARVVVRRSIKASPEEIFDAWLDPDSLAAWMRPRAITRTTVTVDAREQGRFEIVMQHPDGPLVHTGTYRRIERPRRLVFTWISPATEQRESLVTVDLIAGAGVTEVVVTHEQLPGESAAPSHVEGWNDALGLLADRFSASSRSQGAR